MSMTRWAWAARQRRRGRHRNVLFILWGCGFPLKIGRWQDFFGGLHFIPTLCHTNILLMLAVKLLPAAALLAASLGILSCNQGGAKNSAYRDLNKNGKM